MTETTFHAGASVRIKTSDGHVDGTINVSGIPVTASDEFIKTAVDRAEWTVNYIAQTLEGRIRAQLQGPRPVAPSFDFTHAAAPTIPQERPLPKPWSAEDVAQQKASNGDPSETSIPDPNDVYSPPTTVSVLGVELPIPFENWLDEPITLTGNTGGEGQRTAVNAGLTSIGYGQKLRHPAALAIIQSAGELYGRPVRQELGSINDLSKGEASLILSFLKCAEPENLNSLKMAIEVQTCLI